VAKRVIKTPAAATDIKLKPAKGRPMLSWVGKRPLARVPAYPAQHIETFDPMSSLGKPPIEADIWSDWPPGYPRAGLLFHGDNKEVAAHLLANGFRGKVNLIYIDPPYDSGANYVRSVELRGLRTAMGGEEYSIGEQVQYQDIWANDNYLQFMYERLMLFRSLLAENGTIWVHCDWHRSHLIRCVLDEVFGETALLNEVVWQRTDPHNDAVSRLGWVHDTLYWYRAGDSYTYDWAAVAEPMSEAALKEYSLVRMDDGSIVPFTPKLEGIGRRFKLDDCTWKGTDPSRKFVWRGARPAPRRVWPYDLEGMDAAVGRGEFHLRDKTKGAARCRVSDLQNRNGQLLQTIWTEAGRMKGGSDYPTEKPQALLSRIIQASSKRGDIVLDAFAGSGPTLLAAQALGRRWIGCDINRGAVQLAQRRLEQVIRQELRSARAFDSEEIGVSPSQQAFTVWRVNDYDLQIQHNEAVNLACDFIGVEGLKSDTYFDGLLGKSIVKIVPFNHPLTPLDLEEVKRELDARPDEDRGITLVCLGIELAAQGWIEDWNRLRRGRNAVNRIDVIELRADPRYGGIIRHESAVAKVRIDRVGGSIQVEVQDFVSPTIIQRLEQQGGILKPQIDDWRAMVDSVSIDPAYNGEVFNIAIADVPEKKSDLVTGKYDLEAPKDETTVAVKIIDMLGEEVLVTMVV